MQLSQDFLPRDDIPTALVGALDAAWERLASRLEQADNVAEMSGNEPPGELYQALEPHRRVELARVLAISEFACETLCRHPQWLGCLDSSGARIGVADPCGVGRGGGNPCQPCLSSGSRV